MKTERRKPHTGPRAAFHRLPSIEKSFQNIDPAIPHEFVTWDGNMVSMQKYPGKEFEIRIHDRHLGNYARIIIPSRDMLSFMAFVKDATKEAL